MTLQVGDKAVAIPLRDGGRVTVRSGTISVGDKAVLIPGANGQIYAVRPASPQVGDKVIVYPLRNGGHVCLASADDEGGSSPSVMPPGNFNVRPTHTEVEIVVTPDSRLSDLRRLQRSQAADSVSEVQTIARGQIDQIAAGEVGTVVGIDGGEALVELERRADSSVRGRIV